MQTPACVTLTSPSECTIVSHGLLHHLAENLLEIIKRRNLLIKWFPKVVWAYDDVGAKTGIAPIGTLKLPTELLFAYTPT